MITLSKSLASWNSEAFQGVIKKEIEALPHEALPLQKALAQSSYVSETPFLVSVMSVADNDTHISVKLGVFYTGIIAGCNCSDDPSPVDEINEYCELQLEINKSNGETQVMLLPG